MVVNITACMLVQAVKRVYAVSVVNVIGQYSTLHSSETSQPIFMKLEISNRSHLWTHPTHNTSLYVAPAKEVPF